MVHLRANHCTLFYERCFLASTYKSLLTLHNRSSSIYFFRHSPILYRPRLTSRSFATVTNKDVVSLYSILGVEPSASSKSIKDAFIERSKEIHPDMNQDNVENSTAQFRQLAAAYEILSDLEARKSYDLEMGHSTPKIDDVDETYSKSSTEKRGFPPKFVFTPGKKQHRHVKVDLSEERMERAWKAFKHRLQIEEDIGVLNEGKKEEFRRRLDNLRSEIDEMSDMAKTQFKDDLRRFKVRDDMSYPQPNGSPSKSETLSENRLHFSNLMTSVFSDVLKTFKSTFDTVKEAFSYLSKYSNWSMSARRSGSVVGTSLAFYGASQAEYMDRATGVRSYIVPSILIVFTCLFLFNLLVLRRLPDQDEDASQLPFWLKPSEK